MFPSIQVLSFSIPTAILFLVVGYWVGLTLAENHAMRYQLNGSTIFYLGIAVLVCGLIGGRLTYIAGHLNAYQKDPLGIISIDPYTLDPSGAALFAGITTWFYIQRKHLAAWATLDCLVSGLAGLAAAVGFAHLASGDAYGAPSSVPWAISLWGQARHPTQVYEILAALIILLLTWPTRPEGFLLAGKAVPPPGVRFLTMVALFAFSRCFQEAFRGDSAALLGQLRTAMLIAWLVLAISLMIIRRRLPGS